MRCLLLFVVHVVRLISVVRCFGVCRLTLGDLCLPLLFVERLGCWLSVIGCRVVVRCVWCVVCCLLFVVCCCVCYLRACSCLVVVCWMLCVVCFVGVVSDMKCLFDARVC